MVPQAIVFHRKPWPGKEKSINPAEAFQNL